VTPFSKEIKRVTEETAAKRNVMMIEIADEIAIGFASEGGSLSELFRPDTGNKITYI